MFKVKNLEFCRRPTAMLFSLLALSFSGAVFAQIKVGLNQSSIAPDTNLQAEANDGTQLLVRKSTTRVGIGTANPANRLEVDGGANDVSGVRLTQLTNARFLATDANGDIVRGSSGAVGCKCGDFKASFARASHGDWRMLDGNTYTGSCGSFSINADDAIFAQTSGSLGARSAGDPLFLSQTNLPNITLSGSTNRYTHSHGSPQDRPLQPGEYGLTMVSRTGEGTTVNSYDSANSGSEPDILNTPRSIPADLHSHTVSVQLNPGAQTAMDIAARHFSRVAVNYFVCIN